MAHEVFPLPEITYPLVIDTVGKKLALGYTITAYCNNLECYHNAELNLYHLARKLGRDFMAMAPELKRHFYCAKCRETGRPDRNTSFILSSCEWAHTNVGSRHTTPGLR